jgi:hypothetical protein
VTTRRERGRDSELRLAEWLQGHGYPDATANAPGRPGPDLLHTPGLCIEVKARAGLDLPAWLRQAHRQAETYGGTPLLIVRGGNQGPADIGAWAAIQRLDQWIRS